MRRLTRQIFGALATAAIAAVPAAADVITGLDDIEPDSPFVAFVHGIEHNKARVALAASEDASTGRLCRSGYQTTPMRITILDPIEVTETSPVPSAGRWLERFKADRCDGQIIYNGLFVADKDGVKTFPIAPGLTRLGTDLVRDLRPSIVPKASAEDCTKKALYDTNVGLPDGYDPEQQDARYETWTVLACGTLIDMVLRITPIDGGEVVVTIEQQLPR